MPQPEEETLRDANTTPLLRDRREPIVAETPTKPDFSSVTAVYFDLDDTLCAYWDASKLGLRQAFQAHAPEGRTEEEMVLAWARAFQGFAPTLKSTGWYERYLVTGEPTRTEQMRRTLAELGVVDEERALALSETYMRRRDANLRLFHDALTVLDALRGKYPLGLITNGPADIQRQEIATLGIGHYFDHVFIEGEMGEGKPNPTVFERAARAVDRQPEALLMVGNSFKHDIVPALAAGWRAIWIRRASDVPPSATAPEEMPDGAPQPDAIVGSLSEVQAFLT
jgi:putative hydrolase of the HAD superfamily